MKNLKHCVYWDWCIRNRASWTILLVRSSHNFRPCLGSEKKRRRANWKGKKEYSCVVCSRPWDKSKSFVFPCKSPITWAILLSLNCQIFRVSGWNLAPYCWKALMEKMFIGAGKTILGLWLEGYFWVDHILQKSQIMWKFHVILIELYCYRHHK